MDWQKRFDAFDLHDQVTADNSDQFDSRNPAERLCNAPGAAPPFET